MFTKIMDESQLKNYEYRDIDTFQYTYSGAPIPFLNKGLPKKTRSICPECLNIISAMLFEQDGKVIMEKTCKEHGKFRDIIYSDAKIYLELERWHFRDGRGFKNPIVRDATKCPTQCGICNMHLTHTAVANVDLTGRCNLSCNICFADSNKYIYEPSFSEIYQMMKRLRQLEPAPCSTIQFTGGEPTIHPHFLQIVSAARELGFTHIQVASNGVKFADEDFALRARESGLQYISPDGWYHR